MEITARALILTMLGGAIGAPTRFAISALLTRTLQGPSFPVATLTVNVLGSFLLAALTWAAGERLELSASMRLLLGTGLLGAFTTYSTFSVETLLLFERGRFALGVLYMAGTVGAVLVAAFLGMRLASYL